jgi:diaminohydroxyphosphoribosylaminopyrimidine deaminase/5-amino-6-(5-phosphoribosylamino)uracil reductase
MGFNPWIPAFAGMTVDMPNHQKYIKLTIALAQKAKGRTSPNPLVGAVVVKGGKIIAAGYHKRAGSDHAEVVALCRDAKSCISTKDATLYINLEPCSTHGKTPPCTDAIIKSGIKEVVIAMLDPNPKHRGKGIKILKKNKFKITVGILEDEARMINQPYIKYITKKLPYITLKIAQSLDGKIATKSGDSKWITGTQARDYSHQLRDEYDAIMVGTNTVLKDNPRLSLNKPIKNKKFYKIIVDTDLKIKKNAKLFKDAKDFPVIIATCRDAIYRVCSNDIKKDAINGVSTENVIILKIKKNKNGKLNLKDLLKKLAKLEITNILVEGGGQLAGSLLDAKLVDKVMFFIAPKIIGGNESILSVSGKGVSKITDALKLQEVKIKTAGEDLLVEGLINEY